MKSKKWRSELLVNGEIIWQGSFMVCITIPVFITFIFYHIAVVYLLHS